MIECVLVLLILGVIRLFSVIEWVATVVVFACLLMSGLILFVAVESKR